MSRPTGVHYSYGGHTPGAGAVNKELPQHLKQTQRGTNRAHSLQCDGTSQDLQAPQAGAVGLRMLGREGATHHLQDVGGDHLHAAHGCGQRTHDGGEDVEGAHAEEEVLGEKMQEGDGQLHRGDPDSRSLAFLSRSRISLPVASISWRFGFVLGFFGHQNWPFHAQVMKPPQRPKHWVGKASGLMHLGHWERGA